MCGRHGSPHPQARHGLPERQRTAVLMHKYQDLDYKEIGAVLKLSESATKSLLFRAYQTLRERSRSLLMLNSRPKQFHKCSNISIGVRKYTMSVMKTDSKATRCIWLRHNSQTCCSIRSRLACCRENVAACADFSRELHDLQATMQAMTPGKRRSRHRTSIRGSARACARKGQPAASLWERMRARLLYGSSVQFVPRCWALALLL